MVYLRFGKLYLCQTMGETFAFFNSPKYKLTLSVAYGLFLYFFLLAFLPFGVSNYNPEHEYNFTFLFELSKFIPIVTAASLINEFLFKLPFKKDSDFGFVIGWTLWSLALLGVIVFITYNYLGNWHDWQIKSLPGFIFKTATVLVFPAVGVFFYFRYKSLQQKYDAILTNTDSRIDEKSMIHFSGEGSKDNISVSVADFIYAQAQDNYSEIHFLKGDKLAKFLIRSSLGRLLDTLEYDFLHRCHRSYMINLYNVHSIKGSRKDLQINMVHSDIAIPVSQTYVDTTLQLLKKYKQFQ